MKKYNLIFFHIFKCYYKDGNYKNDIPWLTALVLVSVSVLFFFVAIGLSVSELIGFNFLKMMDRHLFILLGFVFVLINYAWFKVGDRYMNIFKKYRHSSYDTKKNAILSWIFVIGGFLSAPIVILLLNR